MKPAVDWAWVSRFIERPAEVRAPPLAESGMVLLNSPLAPQRLRHLWAHSEVHICADGSADRLLEACGDLTPEAVVGDFDSASLRAQEEYRRRGSMVQRIEDQNTTDLEKALAEARSRKCTATVIAGDFSGVEGRLDHTFGIINALYTLKEERLAVIGSTSFMLLLHPGEHLISVPDVDDAPHCGLVPLRGPCERISTTGLRWDMTDALMDFGGLVSVCNRVEPSSGGRVCVRVSDPVVWTCTLPTPE